MMDVLKSIMRMIRARLSAHSPAGAPAAILLCAPHHGSLTRTTPILKAVDVDVVVALDGVAVHENITMILAKAETHRANPLSAPLNASFAIELLIPSAEAEALVGDLEERYTRIRKKYGHRRARLWYWLQTFITLRPLIARCIKTISGLSLVADLYRRIRS
jgi:hypothetical protein